MKTQLTTIVLITVTLFFISPRNIFSQVQQPSIQLKTDIVQFNENANEWKLYLNYDSINVLYKVITCTEEINGATNTLIVLRVENNANNDYQIEWINRLLSEKNINPTNQTEQEAFRRIEIKKDCVLEGRCNGSNLRIYIKSSSQVDLFHITKFQLDKMAIRIVDQVTLDEFH